MPPPPGIHLNRQIKGVGKVCGDFLDQKPTGLMVVPKTVQTFFKRFLNILLILYYPSRKRYIDLSKQNIDSTCSVEVQLVMLTWCHLNVINHVNRDSRTHCYQDSIGELVEQWTNDPDGGQFDSI